MADIKDLWKTYVTPTIAAVEKNAATQLKTGIQNLFVTTKEAATGAILKTPAIQAIKEKETISAIQSATPWIIVAAIVLVMIGLSFGRK